MTTPLSVDGALTLGRFFRDFAHNYREARNVRAANTPHLDVLRIFGLKYAELRHSDVLAWFLDHESEHEQGPLFAQAFLGLCGYHGSIAENYIVERERHGHTDVTCYAREQFTVFVENKVRHSERERQVEDMVFSMANLANQHAIPRERRFAVFLTDRGAPSATAPTADSGDFLLSNYFSLARMDVFECFRVALMRVEDSRRSPLLVNFLDSYLNSLRRLRADLS